MSVATRTPSCTSHTENNNDTSQLLHHEGQEGSNFQGVETCTSNQALEGDLYIVCTLLLVAAVMAIVRNWIVIVKYRQKA